MYIYFLLTIPVFLLLLFFEGVLLSAFGFSLSVVLFLFLYKRVDSKLLLLFILFFSFFLDVSLNLPLGSNLLFYFLAILFFSVLSSFFSSESGVTGYMIFFVAIILYYILYALISRFLVLGSLGFLGWDVVLQSLVKGLFSVLIMIVLQRIYSVVRGGKGGPFLKFK